jgi:3-hydroxyisobutyrate dehydrogenase
MAGHLLKAGHAVTVNTRTRKRAEPLIVAGAIWADSPAAAARGADIAISMVGYPADVTEVWSGPHGFLTVAHRGQLLIDMTTSDPALARALAQEAAVKGAAALDAPVSGGDRGARVGGMPCQGRAEGVDLSVARPGLYGGRKKMQPLELHAQRYLRARCVRGKYYLG